MDAIDPESSRTLDPQAASPRREGRGGILWQHLWTAVFAINMVAPMMFAKGIVGEGGTVGMAIAVGVLWAVGDLFGMQSRRRRHALLCGGAAVAASQVFPILHAASGLFAVVLARLLGAIPNPGNGVPRGLSGFGAFLVTALTGGVLLVASLFVGTTLLTLFGPEGGRGPGPASPAREGDPGRPVPEARASHPRP